MHFTTPSEFDEASSPDHGVEPPTDMEQAYRTVTATFASGVTKQKEWRKKQLKRAWWMIEDNRDRICAALRDDLNKHPQEVLISEVNAVQADILYTLKNLDDWTRDERPARTHPLNFLGNATVRKEPLGVALVIGPWNFPISLLVQPMIAAIAAGCAVVAKPSDIATASETLLMSMIPQYLDTEAIRCVSAGPQEMGYILEHRFNQIFYTGSTSVGKIIHQAAAKYLTPVVLELGGQAPAIVCKSANLDLAAKRLAAVKFMNAGQICLNVNHVLVDPTVRDALVSRLVKCFDEFMEGKEEQAEYYSRIINERNFDRIDGLLSRTHGKIIYGGQRNRSTLFFGPTIVLIRPGDSLLSEELFAPILPIVDADLGEAISLVSRGEHPLALYPFTRDEAEKRRLVNETQSGGVTFNDCLAHAGAHDAPFGGVGNSGMGYYHGKYGFLAFTHLRTCLDMPGWMEKALAFRYPPYTMQKAHKLAPRLKASFDRDGNDVRSKVSWVKYGLVLTVALTIAWNLRGEEINDSLLGKLLK